MFSAVLFDLDGTLLDIELDAFLREYFAALGPVLVSLDGASHAEPRQALHALMAATTAMCDDTSPRTNRAVFNETFRSLSGVDLDGARNVEALDRFYSEVFPHLRANHGPMPGAAEAVASAREAGMRVALATNPIFPLAAIHERMRWAGLESDWFDVITSYETSVACKPSPAYFSQVAEALGVKAHECLFVGDDHDLDMPAAAVGMRTFFVGEGESDSADWRGDLGELATLLAREGS